MTSPHVTPLLPGYNKLMYLLNGPQQAPGVTACESTYGTRDQTGRLVARLVLARLAPGQATCVVLGSDCPEHRFPMHKSPGGGWNCHGYDGEGCGHAHADTGFPGRTEPAKLPESHTRTCPEQESPAESLSEPHSPIQAYLAEMQGFFQGRMRSGVPMAPDEFGPGREQGLPVSITP